MWCASIDVRKGGTVRAAVVLACCLLATGGCGPALASDGAGTGAATAMQAEDLRSGGSWVSAGTQGIATPVVDGAPGIILHELHTQPQVLQADTILTYITSRRVRISHAGGHTLLDLDADRIVFLDPATRTYRETSLRLWEARLQEAIASGAAPGVEIGAVDDSARTPEVARGDAARTPEAVAVESFEPTASSTEIAGYTCDRYHHYGRRTLLGTEETVEQQIWVARALEMPAGAYEAYQRALGSIESVGAGTLLRRPPGVILGVETRTQRAGARRGEMLDIERTTVIRVERVTLPDSLFAIPRHYVPAAQRELPRPEMH